MSESGRSENDMVTSLLSRLAKLDFVKIVDWSSSELEIRPADLDSREPSERRIVVHVDPETLERQFPAILKWARTDRSLEHLYDRSAVWEHLAESLVEDVISAPRQTTHMSIDGVGFEPDDSTVVPRPVLPPGKYQWQ